MLYLILAAVLYATATLIGASAARNANTNIVSLLTNLSSVLIPLLIVLPKATKKSFAGQHYGIMMALLGGVVISLYVLVLNKAFTQNKIGIITPVVYGGTILLSTVLSYLIYREKISGMEGLGLGLVLIGMAFIVYARAVTPS